MTESLHYRVTLLYKQGLSNANELGKGTLMVAGGAAGAVYWLTVYPADIIKSKLQTDSYRQPAYRGTLHCARQVCPHLFAVSAFGPTNKVMQH